jgi:hypothetical protein
MDIDDVDGDLGISRRQLIKRGAIVGGTVLWAAPVVQSITTPAFAQLYGGTGCQCSSTACALRVTGLVTLNACGGNPCVLNAGVNVGGGSITAGTLCATTEATAGANNACDASASVATLTITNVSVGGLVVNAMASVLERTVSAPCGCGAAAVGGRILTLTINGHNALTVEGRAALALLGITVVVNGVSCNNGTTRTAAVDINIKNLLQITVAEVITRAGNCTTC